MNKEEIIDYLEKRYNHIGDSDLKISINAINGLLEKNKQLKEINEEHQKINGELREENKHLREQLDVALKNYDDLLERIDKTTKIYYNELSNGKILYDLGRYV